MSGSHDETVDPYYLGVMLALCALSVTLNGIAVVVVLRFGHVRSSIDLFLANLAVSDILHAGVVLPIHFHDQNFYGGNVVCKVAMFIPLVTIMSTILTIVAIAIERYRTVVLELRAGRKASLVAVVLIWLMSLMTSSPQLYEYRVYDRLSEDLNTSRKSCGSKGNPENFESIYSAVVLGVAYIGPLIIISLCYTKIIRFVWMHARRFRQTGLQPPPSVTQSSSRRTGSVLTARTLMVLKMCGCITGTFAVLWAPYFILFSLTEVSGTDDTANMADLPHHICRMMTVLSTLANPILFLIFNERFRRALWRVVHCTRPAPEGRVGVNENQSRKLSQIAKNRIMESLHVPRRNHRVHAASMDVHVTAI